MQDNLVGYLVGALDEDETAQLEARLQSDPALQAQLQLAAQSLRPLMEEVRQLITTGAIRDAVESGWSASSKETADPSISADQCVAPTSEDMPAVVSDSL